MCRRFVRTFGLTAGTRIGSAPSAATTTRSARMRPRGVCSTNAEPSRAPSGAATGLCSKIRAPDRLGAVGEGADPARRLHRAVLGGDVARAARARAARRAGRRPSRARRGSRPRAAPRGPRAGARSPPSRPRAAGCRAARRGRSRRARRRSPAPRAARRSSRRGSGARARARSAVGRRCGTAPCRRSRSRRCGRSPPIRPCAPRARSRETPCCARCQAVEMPPMPAPMTQTSTSRSTSSGAASVVPVVLPERRPRGHRREGRRKLAIPTRSRRGPELEDVHLRRLAPARGGPARARRVRGAGRDRGRAAGRLPRLATRAAGAPSTSTCRRSRHA